MIWVCRAGQKSIYKDYFLSSSRIYLPWEGYKLDLSTIDSREEFKKLVVKERGTVARTSISNWSGQLYSFCKEMAIGDYVLIPHKGSRYFTYAMIDGNYEFSSNNFNCLWHSRKIKIIATDIPRDIFSQSMQYSLGAFRTVFKIKNEEELLSAICRWKN